MNVVTNSVAYPCKGRLCQVTLKYNYSTLHALGIYPKDEESVKNKQQKNPNRLLFSNHNVSSK